MKSQTPCEGGGSGEKSEILIRAANDKDIQDIVSVVNKAYKRGEDIKRKDVHRTNMEQVSTLISSSDEEIWVATVGPQIVGCVLFEPNYEGDRHGLWSGQYGRKDNEKISYMGMLSVNPDFQRRGIGGKLAKHCEQLTIHRGNKKIVLCCVSTQAKVITMYRKFGYQEVGRHEWPEDFKVKNLRDEFHSTYFVEMSKTLE